MVRVDPLSSSILICCIAFTFVAGLAGCGKSYAKPVAVSGKVTLKGKPLKDGVINFAPVDGENAVFGRGVIEDGAYVAGSLGEDDGLIPGEYNVFFDVNPEGDKTPGVSPIPAKYMSPAASGFKKLIDAETDSLDFNLE